MIEIKPIQTQPINFSTKANQSFNDLSNSPYSRRLQSRKKLTSIKSTQGLNRTSSLLSTKASMKDKEADSTPLPSIQNPTFKAAAAKIYKSSAKLQKVKDKFDSNEVVINHQIFEKIRDSYMENLKNSPSKNLHLNIHLEALDEVLKVLPTIQILSDIKNGIISCLNIDLQNSQNYDTKNLKKESDEKIAKIKKEKTILEKKLKQLSTENVDLASEIDILKKEIYSLKDFSSQHSKAQYFMNSLMEETKRKGETIKLLNEEIHKLRRKEIKNQNIIDAMKKQGVDVEAAVESMKKDKEKSKNLGFRLRISTLPPDNGSQNSDSEISENNNSAIGEFMMPKLSPVPDLKIEKIRRDSFQEFFVTNENLENSWLRA
ncbi:unnamed protein product [Blepharisma stoltei]|uniref:Uncharacterized protein n=1 Tax=Blepharisma stoltei TaxID=1481888 RepID=A0AAU9IIK4_9CILI|nr:unnamed protein product [Blepharisma stoltei]